MADLKSSLRHIKELLRLYFDQYPSLKLIAQAVSASPTIIDDNAVPALAAGLSYLLHEGPDGLSGGALALPAIATA